MDTKKVGCRSLEAKPELKKAEAERGAGQQARHNRFTIADKDSCGASPGRADPWGMDSIIQKNQEKMMKDAAYRSIVPKWMQERVVQEYEERSKNLAVNMIPVEMKKDVEEVCGEDVKKDVEDDVKGDEVEEDVEGACEDDVKEDVEEGGIKPTKSWLRRQRQKRLERTSKQPVKK